MCVSLLLFFCVFYVALPATIGKINVFDEVLINMCGMRPCLTFVKFVYMSALADFPELCHQNSP